MQVAIVGQEPVLYRRSIKANILYGLLLEQAHQEDYGGQSRYHTHNAFALYHTHATAANLAAEGTAVVEAAEVGMVTR
jgi:hypothetical protein